MTCANCYYRNPDTWYCLKKGVDVEDTYPACACFVETHKAERPMETTKKVCKKCGKELPLSDFPEAPRMKDGHLNICRKCQGAAIAAAKAAKKAGEEKNKDPFRNEPVHGELALRDPLDPGPESLRHRAKDAQTPKPSANPLAALEAKDLVVELRARGYEVRCTRTIVEEL